MSKRPRRKGLRRGRTVSILNLPTSHLPGTAGKLRVLQQRAAAGLPLFHPFDALPGDRQALREVSSETGARTESLLRLGDAWVTPEPDSGA